MNTVGVLAVESLR